MSKTNVLAHDDLVRRMSKGDLAERLVVTPLLEKTQIGGASIDLRLGFTFVIPRRANMPSIDPMSSDLGTNAGRHQERVTLSRGKVLTLHPNEFVLGATLEYIRLPTDLTAYVTSRSSWGRAGLVIATAVAVAPGYQGIVTLELANVGPVPLTLRPGVRIAQMIFHNTSQPAKAYSGRYMCPTMPEFGKVHLDPELPFWVAP